MLDDAQYNGAGDQRSGRPRSEGHKYNTSFAQKRASSYGVGFTDFVQVVRTVLLTPYLHFINKSKRWRL